MQPEFLVGETTGRYLLETAAMTRQRLHHMHTDGKGDEAHSVKRVKFKLADRRAALVDIARHLGMFVEQHGISGKDGRPFAHADSHGCGIDCSND